MVGLSYVSPLIGVMIGSIYTGRIGDWFVIKMTRWNKGIMEPEHRLWMFTLSLILIPGSLILCGVGVAHHVHWFGLVFAMCIIAITNTIGVQVSVSYCIDSYQDPQWRGNDNCHSCPEYDEFCCWLWVCLP